MALAGSVPGTPRDDGAAGPGIRVPRTVMPAVDPQMPSSFRQWALRQRPSFDARGNLVVLTPGGSSTGTRPAVLCCWAFAVACLVLLFADPLPVSRGEFLAATAAAAISAVAIRHRSSRHDLWLCRSKVIFPENLDATCQALLGRGQDAISIILSSQVRAADLLENHVADTELRQHEWEIASKLREITNLRALLAANTPGNPAGPMTADVLRAQHRAIEMAQQATTARITALERYARQITAADHADHDWQQATRLSGLNDKYLDLVARTTSDDYATAEIADLTEQLATAARARAGRLHDADLAASVLILPPNPVEPAPSDAAQPSPAVRHRFQDAQ